MGQLETTVVEDCGSVPPPSTLLLVPNILPQNALLNKSVDEIEKLALDDAERISPKYVRGKDIKRKGYSSYRFLKDFTIVLKGRRVIYKVYWVSVTLPILYKRVKTNVEKELEFESNLVLISLLLLYSRW